MTHDVSYMYIVLLDEVLVCAIFCRGIKTPLSSACAVIGQPQRTKLSPTECQAFKHKNVCISDHIMTYPHLLLTEKDRVITSLTSSKATKRNNSCVMYNISDGNGTCIHFGVLVKLILTDSSGTGNFFALLQTLRPADFHLCNGCKIKPAHHCIPPSKASSIIHEYYCNFILVFTYSDDNLTVIPAVSITDKVVMLEVQTNMQYVFISFFPNHSEVE